MNDSSASEADGIRQDVVRKIADADLRIRAAGVGKPVDATARIAADEFRAIGVTLPEHDLRDYALSVVEERPHKFHVNM